MFDGRGSKLQPSPCSRLPQGAQMATLTLGTKAISGMSAEKAGTRFVNVRCRLISGILEAMHRTFAFSQQQKCINRAWSTCLEASSIPAR